ncbi:hypothetical protein [Tenacibaculum maritimum]|uniref:hypothetical protein n=1 Tax=Tenacibaculum maritimum TaxID=107401 RepID=UPI0038760C34
MSLKYVITFLYISVYNAVKHISISISAHYARKFSVSAEASSSIAAKIVSLPAPDSYYEILKSTIKK